MFVGFSNRAQGTIEYLVVIAIIVVVSLVVTNVMISEVGSAGSVSESFSVVGQRTGVGGISVVGSVAGLDGNGVLLLSSPVGDTLSVSKIVVDGVDHNFVGSLYGGESKAFKLKNVDPCVGQSKVYSVKVFYAGSSGLQKTADFKDLSISCLAIAGTISTGSGSSASVVDEYVPPATYTVTFDSQGATVEASPTSKTVTVPATTVVTLPTAPTKTGYTFGGWYTAVDGGGTSFIASTVVTASITVYAKWTAVISYNVTLSPGTMADVATIGTAEWGDPNNAKVSDDNYAIATVGASCFIAGTKIATSTGTELIETLSIGDKILSYNKKTNSKTIGVVTNIFSSEQEGYFILKTNNREVSVTSKHPFLTINGWKLVQELQIGDLLLTENGIEKLNGKTFIEGDVIVYNLTVDSLHTYFANGFVVHNKTGAYFTTVKLVDGAGTIAGNNKATGELPINAWDNPLSVEDYNSFGGETELWGLTLAPSTINDTDFGFVVNFTGYDHGSNYETHYLKATNFGFSIPIEATINGVKVELQNKYWRPTTGARAYIDHVRITIYYTA